MVINQIVGVFICISIPINKGMISSSIFCDVWPWFVGVCLKLKDTPKRNGGENPGNDLTLVIKKPPKSPFRNLNFETHTQVFLSLQLSLNLNSQDLLEKSVLPNENLPVPLDGFNPFLSPCSTPWSCYIPLGAVVPISLAIQGGKPNSGPTKGWWHVEKVSGWWIFI